MKVQIHIRCPQCGGEIDFLEETQVITCNYCGSRLLVTGRQGVLRYVLPPKIATPAEAKQKVIEHLHQHGTGHPHISELFLFYAPFWRMQTAVYRWLFGKKTIQADPWSAAPATTERTKSLTTRILDHTIAGFKDLDLGLYTLGVRSRVLQLIPLDQSHVQKRSSFLPLEIDPDAVKKEVRQLSRTFMDPTDVLPEVVLHRLVGLRYSVIYFPLWYAESRDRDRPSALVLDAVSGNVTTALGDGAPIYLKLMGERSRKSFKFKEILFLPFRCPNCGWDLPLRPLSVLHFCPTCRRLWRDRHGRWTETPYKVAALPEASDQQALLWFPFWCFRARLESKQGTLQTVEDLYRLAPPIRPATTKTKSAGPISFYVPAARFRNPKVPHHLGSRLTTTQPNLSWTRFTPDSKPLVAGAALTAADAKELGPVILGAMVPPKNRRAVEWLKDCRVILEEPNIVFFPFSRLALYWKLVGTSVSFQHNALAEDLAERAAI
jgi:DNA-directed RNA polymerase subunit RPC12/RpoP